VQGLANASFLAGFYMSPAYLIASNRSESLHALEVIGLLIWIGAFVMESVADMQKLAFLHEMKRRNLKNQVCNVGLWRYSRHPNYFAEWMVWNALVIAAIPSWLARSGQDGWVVWILLGLGLLFVSRIMYYTLVYYTGARPAEYYSVQKRPEYRAYQETTNMFFPGPVKAVGGKGPE
jgi:steroid 5-alpha reductase family enzyme